MAKAGHCPVLALRGLWGLRGSTDGAAVSLLQLLRGGREGGRRRRQTRNSFQLVLSDNGFPLCLMPGPSEQLPHQHVVYMAIKEAAIRRVGRWETAHVPPTHPAMLVQEEGAGLGCGERPEVLGRRGLGISSLALVGSCFC